MTDQTPAETLRAAAERLREHVGYLNLLDIRGPWTVHAGPSGYPQSVNNVGVPIHIANTFTGPEAPPVTANYIALMHPGVGLAVADWLDATAGEMRVADGTEYEHTEFASWIAALAVARALLGES
jgi:hypothetical protein